MTETSEWPQDRRRPRDHAGLEVLSYAECLELAASQPVGRVAFAYSGEIEVFPVNHRMVEGAVVFRTAYGSKLGAAVEQAVVAFEVDAFDPAWRGGWSVLIKGRMSEVTDEGMLARLRGAGVQPWSNRVPRPAWILIRPEEVSGRRL